VFCSTSDGSSKHYYSSQEPDILKAPVQALQFFEHFKPEDITDYKNNNQLVVYPSV